MQDYDEFVNKFKPKKTTDDCYTPPAIYEAVLSWCEKEYGIDRASVIRPFKPGGGGYQREDYTGRVVVDNPPFSILAQIVDWYNEHGIKYFLFAPSLTALNYAQRKGVCFVFVDARITYENGAQVRTAFLTNMDDCITRSACDLSRELKAINAQLEHKKAYGRTQNRAHQVAKYNYPSELMTSARLGNLAAKGVTFKVKRAHFVRQLDAQKPLKKTIFGCGLLISRKDAEDIRKQEEQLQDETYTFELSEREKAIVDNL